MTAPDSKPSQVTYAYLRSDGTAYVVLGSALAGLAAYAYQLMGGRVLGAESFAPVSVLLTVHFLTFIVVMMPIEQFTVRQLTVDQRHTRLPSRAYWLAGGTVAAATVFAFAGVDDFLNGDYRFVAFTTLTVGTHFAFASARGHLAGWRRFKEYGLASGTASVLRLAVAVAVTVIHPSASGFAIALIVGPLAVFFWRPFRSPADTSGAAEGPERSPEPGLLTGLVLAAAASQALLLAGPVLVGYLDGSAAEVSIAFAVFTLGRAPLVFGYNLLARVLPPFTRMSLDGQTRELMSWARGMALAGAALSAVAGLLGWWLGPWVVQVAFGPDFVTTGSVTALVAVGVVLAGSGLFVGQILVAEGQTGRLAIAWLVGVLAAGGTLLLALGLSPVARVALAFVVGEALALMALVHGAVVSAGEQARPATSVAYDLTKRTVDIAVALVLGVLMIPVLVAIGVVVRMDSPGPVFFRQERVGKDGVRFRLVKVRTMEADADESVFAEHLARLEASRLTGEAVPIGIEADDRTTRVGRMLRRTSLDEVPNLWNVLRGPLSLVGPRPLVPAEAELIGLEHDRFKVKPGMTGLAQVSGRDALSMSERTRLDEEYVETRSSVRDLRILLSTIRAVFGARRN